MKLIIIIISTLNELYIIKDISYRRIYYINLFIRIFDKYLLINRYETVYQILNFISIIPILFIVWILFLVIKNLFFGTLIIIIQFILLTFCIGPENFINLINNNIRYKENNNYVLYLTIINRNIFSVLLWYAIFGLLGAIFYRFIISIQNVKKMKQFAKNTENIVDWIPIRITALFYLLIGNFQNGYRYFIDNFFCFPRENQKFLYNIVVLSFYTNSYDERFYLSLTCKIIQQIAIAYLILIYFII